MKKSTVKAAKTTAPAKKAPAKIVKKPAAAPVKRASTPAAKAPAVKPVVTKAPAIKTSAAKLSPTVISALVNVGFGNQLFLRGEGPGLSWDTGVPLDCVADDKWTISLPGTGKTVVYKFLINDLSWSVGPDYVVESGAKVTVAPTF
jgi:hypothetical protein